MKKVFALYHTHELDPKYDDKFIGLYTSKAKAIEAKESASKLPGFCDTPSAFEIIEETLNKDEWLEGYITYTWYEQD